MSQSAYAFQVEFLVSLWTELKPNGSLSDATLKIIARAIQQTLGLNVELTVTSPGKSQIRWTTPKVGLKILIQGSVMLSEVNGIYHANADVDMYAHGNHIGQVENIQFVSTKPEKIPVKNRLSLIQSRRYSW